MSPYQGNQTLAGDPGIARHAASIRYGCLALAVGIGALLVRSVWWEDGNQWVPLVALELVVLVALTLNHTRNWMWAVRLIGFGCLLGAASIVVAARDGFRSIAMLSFPGLLVVAVLALRAADYWLLAGSTILTVTALGVAEIRGLIPVVPIARTPTDYTAVIVVNGVLAVIAFFGGHVARNSRLNLNGIRATVAQLAEANRELKRSEARYRSFVELAVDAILVVDRDGFVIEVNRQASALFGVDQEQMRGALMSAVLSPDTADADLFPLERLAEGVPFMRVYRVPVPGGTAVYVEIHAAMLPDGPILCFCRDITERTLAAAERTKLQEQLAQAQKMESVGRLAGGIAHDFNNLLTVINGYSDILLANHSGDGAPVPEVEEIHKAGRRASDLTRQLLAFSRKQVLQPCVVDLNRSVEAVCPMLRRLVGEDVELRVVLDPAGAVVFADPHQLDQVLLNLTVNARDAMPHGGTLTIETTRSVHWGTLTRVHPDSGACGYALLAVSDNGVGMDDELQQRIFEPFFTTKSGAQGTGLGLAMVHGIVEQSGGVIEVDSEVGRGTRFRIYLPVPTATDAEAPPPAVAQAQGGPETVLIVEDQAEVRRFAAGVLSGLGYHVLVAADGAEALQTCEQRRERIDVVLTDVVMPNMSGPELARRLAAVLPDVKLVYMSGYTDDVLVKQGVESHRVQLLEKPFSAHALAMKIRSALGSAESGPRP